MRILLIDDDPDIRMLAGFVLEQAGHALTFAASGSAGIAAATDGAFDVILLDYRLGDMTGADVFAVLRGHEATLPPVVFLTAADEPAMTRAFIEAGAVGVIAKPFDPERLEGDIRALVRTNA